MCSVCILCTPWRRWIQFDMKLWTNDRTLSNSVGLNVNCYFCFEINISDRLSASLNRIFIFIGNIFFFFSSFTHNLSWLGPRVRQCVCVHCTQCQHHFLHIQYTFCVAYILRACIQWGTYRKNLNICTCTFRVMFPFAICVMYCSINRTFVVNACTHVQKERVCVCVWQRLS